MKGFRWCILFTCLTVVRVAYAQEPSFIAPLVNESVLLDAHVGDYIVVVGERGHVLLSTDSKEFTQAIVPTQSTLTSVTAMGDHIWAAGHDAVILHSGDRGISWQVQHYAPQMESPFLDIAFFDNNEGIALGAYGLFFRTIDGGKNWLAERHATLLDPMDINYLNDIRKEEGEEAYLMELDSILPHLNRVTVAGDKVYLAGETGLLAFSADRGKSWQRLTVDYYGSFFDVQVLSLSPLRILAVGLRGNAFYSEDAQTWTSVQTCTTSTLNSLLKKTDDLWIALGNNGVITQFKLPLTSALNASSHQCDNLADVSTSQIESKSALLSVIPVDDSFLAVSAEGLQTLEIQ